MQLNSVELKSSTFMENKRLAQLYLEWWVQFVSILLYSSTPPPPIYLLGATTDKIWQDQPAIITNTAIQTIMQLLSIYNTLLWLTHSSALRNLYLILNYKGNTVSARDSIEYRFHFSNWLVFYWKGTDETWSFLQRSMNDKLPIKLMCFILRLSDTNSCDKSQSLWNILMPTKKGSERCA